MNISTRNPRCRVIPARRRCARPDTTLPSRTIITDLSLLEQTMGPVLRGQSGMCWSPVREVLATHGAFHG